MNEYFIKKKTQEVQEPKLFSLKKEGNFLNIARWIAKKKGQKFVQNKGAILSKMPRTCALLLIFSTFWRDEVLVGSERKQSSPTNFLLSPSSN